MLARRLVLTLWIAATLPMLGADASAQDKIRVGNNPLAASLPLYVGMANGYFKEAQLELELTRLLGGPPNLAALIAGQIDVASNLTTIDGINGNIKKPGVAMYIAINAQNRTYKMEQFMVRKGLGVTTIAGLKGKKILTAPGPANLTMARAVLKANGVNEGEYQLDQLDLGQHVNALVSGTADAAYTLEPAGSILRKLGAAETLEYGIVAKYVLGDADANGWIAGTAMSSDFLKAKPDVARRFAVAWAKAIKFIEANPAEARKSLAKNTLTPDDVVDTVPLVKFTMTQDLTAKDVADFQTFIDFSSNNGILSEKFDVSKALHKF